MRRPRNTRAPFDFAQGADSRWPIGLPLAERSRSQLALQDHTAHHLELPPGWRGHCSHCGIQTKGEERAESCGWAPVSDDERARKRARSVTANPAPLPRWSAMKSRLPPSARNLPKGRAHSPSSPLARSTCRRTASSSNQGGPGMTSVRKARARVMPV